MKIHSYGRFTNNTNNINNTFSVSLTSKGLEVLLLTNNKPITQTKTHTNG
jgi:hypothetical protein